MPKYKSCRKALTISTLHYDQTKYTKYNEQNIHYDQILVP